MFVGFVTNIRYANAIIQHHTLALCGDISRNTPEKSPSGVANVPFQHLTLLACDVMKRCIVATKT